MKKSLMLLMTGVCVMLNADAGDLGDWELTYRVKNTCGVEIDVFHTSSNVGIVDGNTAVRSASLSLHSSINGCDYNIDIETDMTQEDFEKAMHKAGFEIIARNPVSIMPVDHYLPQKKPLFLDNK